MRTQNQYLTSPSGNQRARPNVTSNRTADPLTSPVSNADLAEFIGVESTDPLLPGFALAATQACIDHTNTELLQRQWTYRSDRQPPRQQGYTGIALMAELAPWWISLPLWPVMSIEDITLNGDEAEYDADLHSKPARVQVEGQGSIVIEYTAGHATAQEIDPRLILGIKMLAAYLYEHRGACEMDDAIRKSGAKAIWGCGMVMTL